MVDSGGREGRGEEGVDEWRTDDGWSERRGREGGKGAWDRRSERAAKRKSWREKEGERE